MYSHDFKIIIIVCVLLLTFTLSSHANLSEIGSISALYATKNRRKTMEDFAVRIENEAGTGFYAVLDGHEGNYSAHYGKEYLMKAFVDVIRSNNEQSKKGPKRGLDLERTLIDFTDEMETHIIEAAKQGDHKSGTTCLMVVAEKNQLIVGNVGDSRGVMCNSKGEAIDLSIDHKAGRNKDEEKRIIEANEEMQSRVNERIYGLAMTRSLGDLYSKEKAGENVIISRPEIKTFKLSEHKPKFMILASDGLWDKVTSQAAVDFIATHYLIHEDFGVKELAKKAISSGSADNITVMVIVFKDGTYNLHRSCAAKCISMCFP